MYKRVIRVIQSSSTSWLADSTAELNRTVGSLEARFPPIDFPVAWRY